MPDSEVWWNAALERCDVVTARAVAKHLVTVDGMAPSPADFNREVAVWLEHQALVDANSEGAVSHPSQHGWKDQGLSGVAAARAALRGVEGNNG